jgi:hypothetical protein
VAGWATALDDVVDPWPSLPPAERVAHAEGDAAPATDASSARWPGLPEDADQRDLPPTLDAVDADHARRLDDEQRGV